MSTREYEAMFLLVNTAATADFDETSANVDRILEKHGAELLLKEKWDERKLAYEINGHRRATYYLTYFRAEPEAITEIDQDVHLNQVILRHLVIALDEPYQQHIEHREVDREKMAEETRRSSLSGWGDRKRGDRDRGPDRDRPRRERSDEADGKAPSADAPAAATPAAATPAADAPAAAAPAADAPAAAAPAADAPAADAPAADAPAADAPAADAPAADAPAKKSAVVANEVVNDADTPSADT